MKQTLEDFDLKLITAVLILVLSMAGQEANVEKSLEELISSTSKLFLKNK